MSLWVILLIRCLTFTFLSDVGHITHTCTQHSPSSVSPSNKQHSPQVWVHQFIMLPLQVEALTCLYRRCWFLRKQTDTACTAVAVFCAMDRLSRSYPSSNRSSDTIVVSWEERWRPPTSRLGQPHKRDWHHTLTQNLKAMCLWVILIIRDSTFTFIRCKTYNSHLHTTYTFALQKKKHILLCQWNLVKLINDLTLL